MTDTASSTGEGTEATTENNDSSFSPITSQEDLDKIIGARLDRERSKYSDYSELKAKATRLDELEESQKTELEKANGRAAKAEAKLKEFEHAADVQQWKAQVSEETGVPVKALAGNSLEEIQAHGKVLAEIMGQNSSQQEQGAPRTHLPSEREPSLPLNGDGIENSLKAALGIY